MCILRSTIGLDTIEWIVREIERDRAEGVVVDIHLQSATTDAWAFTQWIDAAPLLHMSRELRRMLQREQNDALLDTIQTSSTGVYLHIKTEDWRTFQVETKVVKYTQKITLETHEIRFSADSDAVAAFADSLKRLGRSV
jgi:type VI protein secretion system component VasF